MIIHNYFYNVHFPWSRPNRYALEMCFNQRMPKNVCHGVLQSLPQQGVDRGLEVSKTRVMEAGLPKHVVNMYPEQSPQHLTERMKNIIKNAFCSPQPITPSTSMAIHATSNFIANKMRYAECIIANEFRMGVVKNTMECHRTITCYWGEESIWLPTSYLPVCWSTGCCAAYLTSYYFPHGQFGSKFAPQTVCTTEFGPHQHWQNVEGIISQVWKRWLQSTCQC